MSIQFLFCWLFDTSFVERGRKQSSQPWLHMGVLELKKEKERGREREMGFRKERKRERERLT